MEYTAHSISNGVSYVAIPADRFKTNELAIDFCLPLREDTAAVNALTVSLLTNSSRQFPDKLSISKELSRLYGASLNTVVQKIGENHCLRIVMSGLDDRFSLGDSISVECIRMLMSLVFNPHLDNNGEFFDADINREKRILVEKIQSQENEKRIYALDRMQEIMFKNEPFAVNKYGKVADVERITPADVKYTWQAMLTTAKIQITSVGSADTEAMLKVINEYFDGLDRKYAPPVKAVFVPRAKSVNTVEEAIDVKQGKLVLGFRVDMEPNDSNTAAMRAFCDVFGGGPYSKLFANVREKMSLCYYCSARYDRRKSIIIIQCGCERHNMDKAINEILNQLDAIKSGDCDEELQASKIGLCDAINSTADDSIVLQSWYSNQITDDVIKTPAQSSRENMDVTKEQVIRCASLLSLDTVYKLYAKEEQ